MSVSQSGRAKAEIQCLGVMLGYFDVGTKR